MKELKPRIHENGMDYVLVGDYYVPDLKLPERLALIRENVAEAAKLREKLAASEENQRKLELRREEASDALEKFLTEPGCLLLICSKHLLSLSQHGLGVFGSDSKPDC